MRLLTENKKELDLITLQNSDPVTIKIRYIIERIRCNRKV